MRFLDAHCLGFVPIFSPSPSFLAIVAMAIGKTIAIQAIVPKAVHHGEVRLGYSIPATLVKRPCAGIVNRRLCGGPRLSYRQFSDVPRSHKKTARGRSG